MTTKERESRDLRVRRTRMMVENAFVELLYEQDFQSITVQAIANRAMVNRATFYDHFTDKYALFEYSVRTRLQQTFESKLPANFTYCADNLQVIIVIVCEFVAEIDDRCRYKHVQGLPSFDEQVVGLVSELLLKWFEEKKVENHSTSARLLADVASWAVYGAARHWSTQEPRKSAEDFARWVVPTISAFLSTEKL